MFFSWLSLAVFANAELAPSHVNSNGGLETGAALGGPRNCANCEEQGLKCCYDKDSRDYYCCVEPTWDPTEEPVTSTPTWSPTGEVTEPPYDPEDDDCPTHSGCSDCLDDDNCIYDTDWDECINQRRPSSNRPTKGLTLVCPDNCPTYSGCDECLQDDTCLYETAGRGSCVNAARAIPTNTIVYECPDLCPTYSGCEDCLDDNKCVFDTAGSGSCVNAENTMPSNTMIFTCPDYCPTYNGCEECLADLTCIFDTAGNYGEGACVNSRSAMPTNSMVFECPDLCPTHSGCNACLADDNCVYDKANGGSCVNAETAIPTNTMIFECPECHECDCQEEDGGVYWDCVLKPRHMCRRFCVKCDQHAQFLARNECPAYANADIAAFQSDELVPHAAKTA